MCDEREPLLAYLYEDGDPVERGRVEAHLASCETCRDELAALRRVRLDLLAWDVPDHGSVWTPFTPVRPAWREMPAWVMAVAASLVLALGATGGVAASALRARTEPAPSVPVVARQMPTAALSADELAALEARVLRKLQDAAPVTPAALATPRDKAVPASISSTEYFELRELITQEHLAVASMTSRVNDLSTTVTQLMQNQQGGPGGRQ